jgi:hypothetical protein
MYLLLHSIRKFHHLTGVRHRHYYYCGVCVFSKRDALVAAHAERRQQHRLQQQRRQQQQLHTQQRGGPVMPSSTSPSGGMGRPLQVNGVTSFSFSQGGGGSKETAHATAGFGLDGRGGECER